MSPTDLYPQNTIVRVLRTDQSFFLRFWEWDFFTFFWQKKIEKSIFRTESGNYGLWPLGHLKGPFKGSLLHLQLLERPPEKKITIDFLDFLGVLTIIIRRNAWHGSMILSAEMCVKQDTEINIVRREKKRFCQRSITDRSSLVFRQPSHRGGRVCGDG